MKYIKLFIMAAIMGLVTSQVCSAMENSQDVQVVKAGYGYGYRGYGYGYGCYRPAPYYGYGYGCYRPAPYYGCYRPYGYGYRGGYGRYW